MFVCPECGAREAGPGRCPQDGVPLAKTDDPLLGTTLGSYRVVRLLGQGGMGSVYLGVQPSIRSRVAIKVLSPEAASSQHVVERFFDEARAVNLIKSENIVNVLDLASLPDGRPYIVMECLEGFPLSQVLARHGRLPLGWLCRLACDVLAALGAAHQAGIVHRDLKPDNVFVTAGGRAKVLDFGIAKLRGDQKLASFETRTGALLGTPQYMSPEQARGQSADARSDIYSLGVILFEAATGRRPFDATSLYDLLRMQVEATPPPLRQLRPDAPAVLEVAVARALAKDPQARQPSAGELSAELLRACEPLPREAFDAPAGSALGSQGALPTPLSPIAGAAWTGTAPTAPSAVSPIAGAAWAGSAPTAPSASSPVRLAPTFPATASTGSAYVVSSAPARSRLGIVVAALGVLALLGLLATLAIIAFLVLRLPAPAPASAISKGPAGSYSIVSATNPGSSSGYSGTVEIAPRSSSFDVRWTLSDGEAYSGVALERGKLLGVGWSSSSSSAAVVVYQVRGGKLSGRWAIAGKTGTGTEDLDGPSGLSGTYRIVRAQNPDGSSYDGSVVVKRTGSVWDVTWKLPSQTFHGVGLLEGDTFVAGYGSGSPGVLIYQATPGGLSGRWAMVGSSETGTEVLRRR